MIPRYVLASLLVINLNAQVLAPVLGREIPGLLSHIAGESVGGSGFVTVSSINTTGATLLGVIVNSSTLNCTITDGVTFGFTGTLNTWTNLTAGTNGSLNVRISYTLNPITSTTHWFALSSCNSSFPSAEIAAFSVASHLDQSTQAGTNGTGTCNPGSLTPAHPNSLILAGAATNGVITSPAVNGGFTLIDSNLGSANANGGFNAYLSQNLVAPVNPTLTSSGGEAQVCAQAVFY